MFISICISIFESICMRAYVLYLAHVGLHLHVSIFVHLRTSVFTCTPSLYRNTRDDIESDFDVCIHTYVFICFSTGK